MILLQLQYGAAHIEVNREYLETHRARTAFDGFIMEAMSTSHGSVPVSFLGTFCRLLVSMAFCLLRRWLELECLVSNRLSVPPTRSSLVKRHMMLWVTGPLVSDIQLNVICGVLRSSLFTLP